MCPLCFRFHAVAAVVRGFGPILAAISGLMVPVPTYAAEDGAGKPNIIVILADDLGYADLGFQGSTQVPTPHLDALAESGVRCTAGYVSCPVCAPTRAGLLTGRYQQRFGFEYNPFRRGLPPSEKTLAELLQPAGYATGAIGKWHLGKAPKYHPLECGFDEFYGFLGGARPYFPIEEGTKKGFLVPNDPLVRNRTEIDDPAYLTDAFGKEAVAFIEHHRNEPFFLYLAFNAVHVPLEATDQSLKRFTGIENSPRRTYAAMVSVMDNAVGRITRKLESAGLDQRTLIVFLSDNGGHPIANAARNDPLRGQKGTVYEGGVRVPFVVTWPKCLPAGESYSQPVISLDIVPTALAAAGLEDSSERHLDGVNLLPYLKGRTADPPHATLYWRYGNHKAIRHGPWKLTMPAGEDEQARLYNLPADTDESDDLSDARPDVVDKLTRLYEKWDGKMERPRWRSLFNKNAPGPHNSER